MKILVAPNALKGSLSAFDAARAIAQGVGRAAPHAEIRELAIADGGDGTAEVLCRAHGGGFRETSTLDPLGRPRPARYALLPDGTAVVDVATASGLSLLESHERRASRATSYGTGQLIRAALDAGCRRIILGVGGSASVDAGAGILEALGARFFDATAQPLARGGGALARLAGIDLSALHPRARAVPIEVACDVDCVLLGEAGAARLFGPQKGASPLEVTQLEAALAHFASVLEQQLGVDVRRARHGGAAGGIAYGLHAALGAKLLPGIDVVLDALGFDAALDGASLCVTAEGQLDRQSLHQKGPWGVAQRAKARAVPVIALAGAIAEDVVDADFRAFTGMFSLCARPLSLREAMAQAAPLLSSAAERATRLFCYGRSE